MTNIAARLMLLSWRLDVVCTYVAELKAHFKRLLALAEKMTANMLAMDVSETDKPTLAMKLEVVLALYSAGAPHRAHGGAIYACVGNSTEARAA
jgi:hypothetical protein